MCCRVDELSKSFDRVEASLFEKWRRNGSPSVVVGDLVILNEAGRAELSSMLNKMPIRRPLLFLV